MRGQPSVTARSGVAALAAVAALALGPAAAPATPDPGVGITLQGVVLRERGASFAVIVDPATPKPGFYRVGAAVGGGRLIRILTDRVLVDFGSGNILHLKLPAGAVPGTGLPGNAGGAAGGATTAGRRADSTSTEEPGQTPTPTSITRGLPSIIGSEPTSSSQEGVAGGATGATPGSAPQASASPSGQLHFVGIKHDASQVQAAQFSTESLRDLMINVDYGNLSGSSKQRLEIYTPEGSLYRRVTRDFTPSGSSFLVETKVPVGGTWITSHLLLGTWSVKVYLGSSSSPLATGNFVLTQ